MGTTTTTFALNKPTVGGDDNAWGADLNTNADKLDDLLDGTIGITPNLLTGWEVGGTAVTSTAAELNILDGVTATTAELNILDGITATTAELNILDGVTATTAEINAIDGVTVTGTALIRAADAAAGRTAIGAGAVATASSGVGQFLILNPGLGVGLQLPAGGTWKYAAYRFNSGVVADAAVGIASGGSVVGASAGGQNWLGWAERIS